MIIETDRTGTVQALESALTALDQDNRVKSLLVLACDENGFTPDQVDPILHSVSKPVFGGVFPKIIAECDVLDRGCIVAGLIHEAEIQTIRGLSDDSVDYEMQMSEDLCDGGGQTMFVFVDGLASRIGTLIQDLFNVYGLEFNYIGGGAGSLSFEPKPCLFTNDGLVQDSALLVHVSFESGVGVSHGWNDVAGPYQVTESDGNRILGLDWKPAFDVYREIVEDHSGKQFTGDNFFDLAKSYPFGINKLGTEKVVRDPIMVTEDGALVCVGEVPQESYVHILTGNTDSLVGAAANALTLSESSLQRGDESQTTLLIDCISRVLFLQDDFDLELKAVSRDGVPLLGALTLGEIANNRKDYLEFYNKTSVVGVLQG